MNDGKLVIRGSRFWSLTFLLIGLILLCLCVWLVYQVTVSKQFDTGVLVLIATSLFFTALGLSQFTTILVIDGGWLRLKSTFIDQRVNLNELTKAEHYLQPSASFHYPILRLTDRQGNVARITPSYFDSKDIEKLVTKLHPYVFRIGVDRNFMNLQLFDEKGLDLPKTPLRQILRGTLMYVLLPCVILTLLLVAWAMFTNQPTFH